MHWIFVIEAANLLTFISFSRVEPFAVVDLFWQKI